MRDDRVFFFSRQLWTGTYDATYLARASTAGIFVRPPAHAEGCTTPPCKVGAMEEYSVYVHEADVHFHALRPHLPCSTNSC